MEPNAAITLFGLVIVLLIADAVAVHRLGRHYYRAMCWLPLPGGTPLVQTDALEGGARRSTARVEAVLDDGELRAHGRGPLRHVLVRASVVGATGGGGAYFGLSASMSLAMATLATTTLGVCVVAVEVSRPLALGASAVLVALGWVLAAAWRHGARVLAAEIRRE